MGMVTVELSNWQGERHAYFVTQTSSVAVISKHHQTVVVFDGIEYFHHQDYEEVRYMFISAFDALNEQ